MKQLLVAFICLLLLSTALKDLMIYGLYYSNVSYISETYCVNKNDSNKTCKGRCFLTKVLLENNNEENNNPALPCPEEKTCFLFDLPFEVIMILYTELKEESFLNP